MIVASLGYWGGPCLSNQRGNLLHTESLHTELCSGFFSVAGINTLAKSNPEKRVYVAYTSRS